MLDRDVAADLLRRHVLWPGEGIESASDAVVATALRRFAVAAEREDWLVGAETWVADVIVATRTDLLVHGQPERFGFLLLADGGEVYVNDADALAALGARLPDGLDPVAYAELLVQFHPYSSAVRTVLVGADDLRQQHDRAGLPAVTPFRTDATDGEVRLTFTSSIRYRRPLIGTLVDLADWTVTVPAAGPARWMSRLTAQGIPVGD